MNIQETQSKPSTTNKAAEASDSSESIGTSSSTTGTNDHGAKFITVCDSRNRRVRGLQIRNGRYYGQLWIDRGDGKKTARRFPLANEEKAPVRNLQEAKEALEVLRNDRRENALPTAGRKPTFADYCETYFAKAIVTRKRAGTLENERQAIGRWKSSIGHVRIDRIATPMIAAYVDKRMKGGTFGGRELQPVSERTANLDLLMLRNVLKNALDDGHLRELPKMKSLEEAPTPKRPLITPAEFERLIASARSACVKNGEQVADYLRFLALSGAREQEALRVKWEDVDFERERVTIGADGLAKNWESRTVEFNPLLGSLLLEMKARRAPDCSWLFPSPQRGNRDANAQSFRESLKMARAAAGLPWVGFHDLRHYFCSVCVMAGIDFMTIAAWMGHKDGGILVGKVYGHLLDEHRSKAAKNVNFGLSLVRTGTDGN
ncbi:MAG: site-specific integrase [Chthoniobacteraceae bacterium]